MINRFISDTEVLLKKVVLSVEEMKFLLTNYCKIQRPSNVNRLQKMCNDIMSNHWNYESGNCIQFDVNGNIIDGKHRITSHISCNRPLIVNVTYGLPTKSILDIDTGLPRTSSQNSVMLDSFDTGISPTLSDFRNKKRELSICNMIMKKFLKKAFPSNRELIDFYDDHKRAIDFSLVPTKFLKVNKRPGYQAAIAVFFEKDPSNAIRFRDLMGGDGSNLASGSPVLALRNYFVSRYGGGSQVYWDYYASVKCIHSYMNKFPIFKVSYQRQWQF